MPPAPLRTAAIACAGLLAALAPFAFQPLVPAIGRYAYLAVAPLALAIGGVVHLVTTPPRASGAVTWWAQHRPLLCLVPWAAAWLVALVQVLGAHRAAKDLAAAVTSGLARTVAGRTEPCFVEGAPWFVMRGGVPYASVIRYGVADSLRPPFGSRGGEVYVLPGEPVAGAASTTSPLRAAPGGCHLRWAPAAGERGAVGQWEEARDSRAAAEPAPRVDAWLEIAGGRVVRVRTAPVDASLRVVWVTQGNSTVVGLGAAAAAAGDGVPVPREFLQSMVRLYPDTAVHWRLEILAPEGDVESASRWSEVPAAILDEIEWPQKRSPSPRIQ
jgi:hypothetical protein